ncbi:hydroxymethyltransferase [Salmonella enterica subsp. enterica serovar Daytona]|uniref:Hydroxymethyltransferase n=1 Tax=Salmonella enterica subsp. enterica serovar Daytona TaxID=1962639 RepID=A0A447JNR3_SALET|nr:hydroxymethyltransferase [Salmonella enterica subsp. enterica serovar Daytona]
MVKQVTKALLTPAMLWQIPGGHMPTVEEGVSKISAAHFASGGTFFMGDARIGSDPDTLSLQLLNTALNSATYGVPTVGDFLRKDKGYDWGQMQALNYRTLTSFRSYGAVVLLSVLRQSILTVKTAAGWRIKW